MKDACFYSAYATAGEGPPHLPRQQIFDVHAGKLGGGPSSLVAMGKEHPCCILGNLQKICGLGVCVGLAELLDRVHAGSHLRCRTNDWACMHKLILKFLLRLAGVPSWAKS